MARAFGVEVEEISIKEIGERYEHLNLDGVTGGVYLPLDGQGDPANIALALAKGARNRGAKIIEGVKVTGVTQENGHATGVTTAEGNIEADLCCELCGHVGPRSWQDGGGECAAASLRAFLHCHRSHRRV